MTTSVMRSRCGPVKRSDDAVMIRLVMRSVQVTRSVTRSGDAVGKMPSVTRSGVAVGDAVSVMRSVLPLMRSR